MILAAEVEQEKQEDRERSACTNSPANGPDFDADNLGGVPLIDTITVKSRITSHGLAAEQLRAKVDGNGTFLNDFFGWQTLGGGGLVQVRSGGDKMFARVEASLPNRAYGHNGTAVSVADARTLLRSVLDEAAEQVAWASSNPEDFDISRLDLVRDFHGVSNLDHLLTGLRRLRVGRSGNPQLFSDHVSGGALTLARGVVGTWRTSLYGKQAQVLHLASQEQDPLRRQWLQARAVQACGHVRFEAQLRRGALQREGIKTMADLKPESLLTARQHYFEKARFGEPVGGAPRIVEVGEGLVQTGDPDYKKFGSVVATLMAEAQGWPPPHSSNTTKRDRSLARKWGISAADMCNVGGGPVMLDFTTGTLRAAA